MFHHRGGNDLRIKLFYGSLCLDPRGREYTDWLIKADQCVSIDCFMKDYTVIPADTFVKKSLWFMSLNKHAGMRLCCKLMRMNLCVYMFSTKPALPVNIKQDRSLEAVTFYCPLLALRQNTFGSGNFPPFGSNRVQSVVFLQWNIPVCVLVSTVTL